MENRLKAKIIMLAATPVVNGIGGIQFQGIEGDAASVIEQASDVAKMFINDFPKEKIIPQHYYIVSDGEIGKGDYFVSYLGSGGLLPTVTKHDGISHIGKEDKKIEATTDRSLGLPGISNGTTSWYHKQFSEEPKILLELENPFENLIPESTGPLQLKLTKDDEVIMYPDKIDWDEESLEEIKDIAKAAYDAGWFDCYDRKKPIFKDWWDKNF